MVPAETQNPNKQILKWIISDGSEVRSTVKGSRFKQFSRQRQSGPIRLRQGCSPATPLTPQRRFFFFKVGQASPFETFWMDLRDPPAGFLTACCLVMGQDGGVCDAERLKTLRKKKKNSLVLMGRRSATACGGG